MKCPADETDLQMTERQNVEIDYCPKCRGVWLDKGELDKIIDKVAQNDAQDQPVQQGQVVNEPYYQPQYQGGKHGLMGYGKHGRKKSILGELFDF